MISVTRRRQPCGRLTDRETQTLFHRDRSDQLNRDRGIVTRHNHLGALFQGNRAGHVGRTEVELRTIVVEERRVTATLFFRQNVDLALELREAGSRCPAWPEPDRVRRPLSSCREQAADVVAGLALVEKFPEHFETGNGRLHRRLQTDDLNFGRSA